MEDAPGAPRWLEGVLLPLNAFIKPTAEALSQGLTFRENFAGEVRVVEVTPEEDWVTPAMSDGWEAVTDAPAMAYRKLLDGTVQVRGRASYASGTPSAQDAIIPIPSGWEPEGREVFDCYGTAGGVYTPAVLTCHTEALRWITGGYTNLSVSGDVWWTASDRTPPRWTRPVDVKLGSPQKPFRGKPGAVIPLFARKKSSATAPAVAAHVDWTAINLERQASAPGVRIHRIWGLEPAVEYAVTLLILPE